MNAGPIVVISATLLLLTGASDLFAQRHASTSIDGFGGVPWGASSEDIVAKFGEPAQVDSLENGIVVLAYREDFLGEPAVAMFALLGDEGMIKGQHTLKLHLEEGDCEAQYRLYRDYVTLSYPLIPPVENYDYPFTEDFCTALQNRRGEWANQWVDRSNGSVVTVIVPRGTDEVRLIYESATFLSWLDSESAPED
ncbi:MAG: hypothetical protein Q8W45_11230 [Candidatus Palauibacterales bacterium]|jgi:hypothetical protein|nr:hypothetical protein [Candidatus Palauibacterales bacterium]